MEDEWELTGRRAEGTACLRTLSQGQSDDSEELRKASMGTTEGGQAHPPDAGAQGCVTSLGHQEAVAAVPERKACPAHMLGPAARLCGVAPPGGRDENQNLNLLAWWKRPQF